MADVNYERIAALFEYLARTVTGTVTDENPPETPTDEECERMAMELRILVHRFEQLAIATRPTK